jgi:hypothetical protein
VRFYLYFFPLQLATGVQQGRARRELKSRVSCSPQISDKSISDVLFFFLPRFGSETTQTLRCAAIVPVRHRRLVARFPLFSWAIVSAAKISPRLQHITQASAFADLFAFLLGPRLGVL